MWRFAGKTAASREIRAHPERRRSRAGEAGEAGESAPAPPAISAAPLRYTSVRGAGR